MTFTSTILRNIKLLTAAQIIVSVAGLLSSALLARALGTDGFGVLGFGTAFLSLLGVAASLNTDMYGTREIARSPNDAGSIASAVIGLRLVLSIVVFVIFVGVVYLLDRSQSEKTVLLIQAGGIFVSLFVLDFVFQGLERMGINGLRQISVALVTLGGVYLFVRSPDDLRMAAAIPVGAGLLAVGAIWIYAQVSSSGKITGLGLTFSLTRWRRILSVSLPMAISGIMHTIIFNTDAVMLGLMSTNEQTGLYVSAFKIVGLTLIPAGLLISPFFPSLSAGWDDQKLRHDRSKTFATSLLIFSLPLVVFIALFPELILRVLFGEAFSDAGPVLLILMASMVMMHLRFIYGNPLLAWNDERFLMIATLIGAVLNIVLNYILIPDYGIIGAAYASLISQTVIVLAAAYRFKVKTMTLHLGLMVRALLCMGVAAASVWYLAITFGPFFKMSILTLTVNCIIFGVIYLIAVGLVFRPNLKQILNPEH
jgi:O-antigen/teichoic acid export membrane protein